MTGTKANKHRGEVEVTLNDEVFVMRPTFTSLDAIETALNTSIPALGERLESGDCRLREMATVFLIAINENPEVKRKLHLNAVGDAIIKGGGLRAYYEPMLVFLANATSGGHTSEEDDDKKKEEPQSPSTIEASSDSPSSN